MHAWYNTLVDIKINSYLPKTSVEGPGIRFCIWVQGCSICCDGCANSHMWDKSGGRSVSIDELILEISRYKNEIEGVTFLGGEPLEQIEAVIELSKTVKKMGLSVIVFTGNEYENIKNDDLVRELVKHIDILIDGRYDASKRDFSRAWVGSSNQKYYFFTNRYDEKIISEYKNKFEVRFEKNSSVSVNGMGDYEKISKLINQ